MTTYRFGGEQLTGLAALLGVRAGLVALANRFCREAWGCATFDEEEALTDRFLSEFMARIAACFAREEELMAEYYYAAGEEHRAEHDAFTAQLYTLRRRHKLGEPAMSIEIFQAVRDWFLTHWEDADGRLFPFLERVAMFSTIDEGRLPAENENGRDLYGRAEASAVN